MIIKCGFNECNDKDEIVNDAQEIYSTSRYVVLTTDCTDKYSGVEYGRIEVGLLNDDGDIVEFVPIDKIIKKFLDNP